MVVVALLLVEPVGTRTNANKNQMFDFNFNLNSRIGLIKNLIMSSKYLRKNVYLLMSLLCLLYSCRLAFCQPSTYTPLLCCLPTSAVHLITITSHLNSKISTTTTITVMTTPLTMTIHLLCLCLCATLLDLLAGWLRGKTFTSASLKISHYLINFPRIRPPLTPNLNTKNGDVFVLLL